MLIFNEIILIEDHETFKDMVTQSERLRTEALLRDESVTEFIAKFWQRSIVDQFTPGEVQFIDHLYKYWLFDTPFAVLVTYELNFSDDYRSKLIVTRSRVDAPHCDQTLKDKGDSQMIQQDNYEFFSLGALIYDMLCWVQRNPSMLDKALINGLYNIVIHWESFEATLIINNLVSNDLVYDCDKIAGIVSFDECLVDLI
jgi:hypothetical protein